MVSLRKLVPATLLATSLVFGGAPECYVEDPFPLELKEHRYEVRRNKNGGRNQEIGIDGLEKNVAGHVSMKIDKEGDGYSVDFSASSAVSLSSLLAGFDHSSHFEMSGSSEDKENSYRSLESTLRNTFRFLIFPLSDTSKYSFGHGKNGDMVKIKTNSDKERRFDISSDTRDPFALLAKFFSGDCYREGEHYLGKIKGDRNEAAVDVYANISKEDGGYLAKLVIPENVFLKEALPMNIHYNKDNENIKISRMDFFISRYLNSWVAAFPAEKN